MLDFLVKLEIAVVICAFAIFYAVVAIPYVIYLDAMRFGAWLRHRITGSP